MKLKLSKEFPYAYEPHLHTCEGSRCAVSSGKEMAVACKEAGYSGIMVTDHFYYGNTAVSRNLPWQDWVMEYCKGFEAARREGDRIGLQVFFGWESTYEGTDFLVYGLDKEWLLQHEEIRDASIREQFELVHQYNGMIVHAHPFRRDYYIPEVRLFPEYVDGVETVNATHSCVLSKNHYNPEFDVLATAYADKHNLPVTAGSDAHSRDLLYGGVAFSRRLNSVEDYIKAVKNREACILLNGNEISEKF